MAIGYLFTATPPDMDGYEPTLREARIRYGAKESTHALHMPMSRTLIHAVMMGTGSHLVTFDTNTPVQTNSETMMVKVGNHPLASRDVTGQLNQFLAEWGQGSDPLPLNGEIDVSQIWDVIWRTVVDQTAAAQQSYVVAMADFYQAHHPRDLERTPTFNMDMDTADQLRSMTYQKASDMLRWIIRA